MPNGTEIAKAYVQIIPSAQGIKGNIEKELSGEMATAGTASGNLLGKELVGTLQKVIAAAGIGKILKDALDEGAKLQQSFGGLDTIYENAAPALQNYARLAAEAGISANDYAEQAVSFGAALKDAYGGDAVKAAEAANSVIMAVADNSAKMGTDIGSVQAAFQGFAKGQYTLLDNLKLGYGGTKSEMERLLADAEKFSGIHYDINNLGDVYSAVGAIQEKLGIAGVAAEEAKTTFSGSFGAMQAAATNVLASLSRGEGINFALGQLSMTVQTFIFDNLIPMLGNIFTALPTVIQTGIPAIIEGCAEIFTQLAPFLSEESINAGLEMVTSLANGVAQQIPEFLAQALPMILQFTENLRSNFGNIVDAGINILKSLVQGLISAFPTLIQTVPQIIINIAGVINDNMPKILKAGLDIIVMLGKGIIDNMPVIVANMGNIVQAVVSVVMAMNWIDLGSKVLTGIVNGLKAMASNVTGFFKGLIDGIKTGFTSVDWGSLGKAIINGIINGLKNAGGLLVDAAKNLAKSAFEGAKSFLGINSPSKLFRDEIGAMMAEGMAIGFEENVPTAEIEDSLRPMANIVPDVFGGSQYSYGGFTINVYGAPGQSVQDLADIVSDRINHSIRSRQAVFA